MQPTLHGEKRVQDKFEAKRPIPHSPKLGSSTNRDVESNTRALSPATLPPPNGERDISSFSSSPHQEPQERTDTHASFILHVSSWRPAPLSVSHCPALPDLRLQLALHYLSVLLTRLDDPLRRQQQLTSELHSLVLGHVQTAPQ